MLWEGTNKTDCERLDSQWLVPSMGTWGALDDLCAQDKVFAAVAATLDVAPDEVETTLIHMLARREELELPAWLRYRDIDGSDLPELDVPPTPAPTPSPTSEPAWYEGGHTAPGHAGGLAEGHGSSQPTGHGRGHGVRLVDSSRRPEFGFSADPGLGRGHGGRRGRNGERRYLAGQILLYPKSLPLSGWPVAWSETHHPVPAPSPTGWSMDTQAQAPYWQVIRPKEPISTRPCKSQRPANWPSWASERVVFGAEGQSSGE